MIHTAIRQLCTLPTTSISSGLSTPWPTTLSVATSHAASSPVLRTPQPCELRQPTNNTYNPPPLPDAYQPYPRADWPGTTEQAFNSICTGGMLLPLGLTLDPSKDVPHHPTDAQRTSDEGESQTKSVLLYLDDLRSHDRA